MSIRCLHHDLIDEYESWLKNHKIDYTNGKKRDRFCEHPYLICELTQLFVKLSNADLNRNWVGYILDSLAFDNDWSLGDLARALLIVKLRTNMTNPQKENEEIIDLIIKTGPPPKRGIGGGVLIKTMSQLKPGQWFLIPYKIQTRQSLNKKLSKIKKHFNRNDLEYYQDEQGNWIILRASDTTME